MYFLSVGKVLRPLLQVIHMVTSAKGAEEFYTVDDNAARSEGLEEARMRDTKGPCTHDVPEYYLVPFLASSFSIHAPH